MSGKCHVDPIQKISSNEEQRKSKAVTLNLLGVGCSNCATRIHNQILLLNGVLDVYVDHERSIANVVFNPDLVTVSKLLDAVHREGGDGMHEYQAEVDEIRDIP